MNRRQGGNQQYILKFLAVHSLPQLQGMKIFAGYV